MAIQDVPRADDERVLIMLKGRDEGYSSAQIGRWFNMTSSRVRTLTNRVHAEVKAQDIKLPQSQFANGVSKT